MHSRGERLGKRSFTTVELNSGGYHLGRLLLHTSRGSQNAHITCMPTRFTPQGLAGGFVQMVLGLAAVHQAPQIVYWGLRGSMCIAHQDMYFDRKKQKLDPISNGTATGKTTVIQQQ